MERKTRRGFIKIGTAGIIAGATAGVGLPLLTASRARAAAVHPFGYPIGGLNVETTRQMGYNGYKGISLNGAVHKHCAFASFHAIIGGLAEVVGYPYDTVPTQMMEWASGGVAGFSTFCGALNGACTAIGLICSNTDAVGFISDLLSWYAEAPLPTNIIAPSGPLAQSAARTNLCHMSVTNWCMASGFSSGSPERSERCARLAGDVAAQAVASASATACPR